MSIQIRFRGGSTVEHSTFTGAEREMTVDTTKDTLVVHDGSTVGGFPMAREDMANISPAAIPGLQNGTILDVTPSVQTGTHTLALTDRGRSVDTAFDVTIPLNASVAFPNGSTITITNVGAPAINILPTAGVTLRLSGTTNTGQRGLNSYGVATIRKIGTDEWIIVGSGVF